MKLTISTSAQSIISPKLRPDTLILLNYDDGVGPYSPHGLEALQISFKLVLISKGMPMDDYDLSMPSDLGPIHIKGYSARFFGSNLKIDFNARYHLLSLSDDGEVLEDNLQIEDRQISS